VGPPGNAPPSYPEKVLPPYPGGPVNNHSPTAPPAGEDIFNNFIENFKPTSYKLMLPLVASKHVHVMKKYVLIG